MHGVTSGGRACGRTTANVTRAFATREQILKTRFHEGPATHIPGLFLTPNQLLRIRISIKHFFQSYFRKRIELFEANNRDAIWVRIGALPHRPTPAEMLGWGPRSRATDTSGALPIDHSKRGALFHPIGAAPMGTPGLGNLVGRATAQ